MVQNPCQMRIVTVLSDFLVVRDGGLFLLNWLGLDWTGL